MGGIVIQEKLNNTSIVLSCIKLVVVRMSSSLNFKTYGASGGAYGTHSNSSGGSHNSSSSNRNHNNTTRYTRQRRNPGEYGPFSSPHGSFDDPISFPPYAELPFTSLKRRRQLQDNNSFVKWAMRAVLLSPVVVLVLWSVVAVMFASTHHVGQQQRNNNISGNSLRKKPRSGTKRMLPPNIGNGFKNNNIQPNVVYMQSNANSQQQPQQQLQDQQGNIIYNVNGIPMMMVPQQQQQLQGIPLRKAQVVQSQNSMSNYQQSPAPPLQAQGNHIPVIAPLGSPINNAPIMNIQQPYEQQVPQQVAGGSYTAVQSQKDFVATNEIAARSVENDSVASVSELALQQPRMSSTGSTGQQQQLSSNGSIVDNTGNSINAVQIPNAMQQQQTSDLPMENFSVGGEIQGKLQDSAPKQAVYYYDPIDTRVSQTGDILQLPVLVYDSHGNAIPLSELQHQAPIYVQPPILGSTTTGDSVGADNASSTTTTNGGVVEDGVSNHPELVSELVIGASNLTESASTISSNSVDVVNPDLVPEFALGASIAMPQAWGSSTSQDQTIIIATVAVMALLVGALSARRLRSKSFLSSCIENETLEDDVAYDTAYTTTAAASGAVGADSSYNTFGGWKGDLEKFDV